MSRHQNKISDIDLLIKYADTPRRVEVMEMLKQSKSVPEASNKLKAMGKGISVRGIGRMIQAIRRKMGAVGEGTHFIAPTNMPEGFGVTGTSTLYKDGEASIQWVKTNKQEIDKFQAFVDAVNTVLEEIDGKASPVPAPEIENEELLAVYNIGDAHIGMLAHHSEAGDDHDLIKAENDLLSAMKSLVKSAPPSHTALIIDVGDFFHADNQNNETSHSKNKLDVDGRWFKVLKVGLMIMVELVNEALKKHQIVRVKNAIGNHNEHSAIYLALFLASWFRNEPRVHVDDNPNMFWYYNFGKVLIGVTHGHTAKPQDLGEIMACDCVDLWSASKYRYWYTGHVHHDQVKEYRTHKFESFRTLASRDAWHASSGYRSGRDMKCIILHKNFGEIQRHIVNIDMLRNKGD